MDRPPYLGLLEEMIANSHEDMRLRRYFSDFPSHRTALRRLYGTLNAILGLCDVDSEGDIKVGGTD